MRVTIELTPEQAEEITIQYIASMFAKASSNKKPAKKDVRLGVSKMWPDLDDDIVDTLKDIDFPNWVGVGVIRNLIKSRRKYFNLPDGTIDSHLNGLKKLKRVKVKTQGNRNLYSVKGL